MTKLLCETESVLVGKYSTFWVPLLQALIGLFELPEDESVADSEHFTDIDATAASAGYQSAYSRLVFAGKAVDAADAANDPVLSQDVRVELASSLGKCSTRHPGMLVPLVSQLQDVPKQYLQGYLTKAGVAIN